MCVEQGREKATDPTNRSAIYYRTLWLKRVEHKKKKKTRLYNYKYTPPVCVRVCMPPVVAATQRANDAAGTYPMYVYGR